MLEDFKCIERQDNMDEGKASFRRVVPENTSSTYRMSLVEQRNL